MDYLNAYRYELQSKLKEKGWSRCDGEMWWRNDDHSQSFNWEYLIVHMFLGKTSRRIKGRVKTHPPITVKNKKCRTCHDFVLLDNAYVCIRKDKSVPCV